MRWRSICFYLGALLASGCASVPEDSGFGHVQSAVADRTGQEIHWNQDSRPDPKVAAALEQQLRQQLSADDAVRITLLNNRGLQATYEKLGIAQAELVEAGLLKNPTLSAEVRFPKSPALPFDIDLTQEFLHLLFLPTRKRIATAEFETTRWQVTDEVVAKVAEAKAAYYRAAGAQQLLELRQTIVQAASASLNAAQRLHDAGNITDRALASEQANCETSRIELERAESMARETHEQLGGVMGLDGSQTDWTIATRLPDLPTAEVEPGGLEKMAIERRADLNAARSQVTALAAALGMHNSTGGLSDANVSVHYSGEPDGTRTIGPGIEIPLPLFNQGQPAIAAAKARLRQAEQHEAAMMIQVRSDVRIARNRVLSAREQALRQLQVILPLRQKILEQTQLEYNAMQAGVFELLQAKQAEIDAGRDYVESLQRYWTSRTELEHATGGILPAPTPAPTTQPQASNREINHGL